MLPLIRQKRNVPNLFDDFFGRNFWNDVFEKPEWSSNPAVNVYEKKDDFEIEVAAPGLEKGDFHIDLKDNVLTVSSEKKESKEEKEDGKVVFTEFNYSTFSRSFRLPEGIDANNIKATHKNGVLKVILPKREEYKQQAPRMIEIS
ncbi:Hsp20/alpha crystallin family protein [Sunxiuqinia elliptica]|uniref:Heat shock protein Hsp20 n=1 Tax=Sunxiuqinia elliptica TaxID=655355 RepID=A0A4R6H6P4_9BACT|nr:Hsp20/alpha crystallin family protein [Sunxiuqinia elliptica]TDO03231.1 heat shock protein Hsp20 [Sunxiuqinia elliptica]TDO59428.1 heat shock protein Hsp20 [Sunxiuqinia elliptica]